MFVSLDPPVGVRREAAEWGRLASGAARGLRPVPPEAIHVTLAFLGTTPIGQIGAVSEAIDSSARPVEPIEAGAPVWLPGRRPRALALELREPKGELTALREDLVERIGIATGWKPERSGFRPHLTVGRAGRGFRPSGVDLGPAPALRFTPESITLYRSHLEPTGARYESLYTLPLRFPEGREGDEWNH